MPKKLKPLGKPISINIEIQNISHQGIWIFIDNKKYLMPFSKFPWFLQATIAQIYDLKIFHQKHLYWPELDIDIDIDSIKKPEDYPLMYTSKAD